MPRLRKPKAPKIEYLGDEVPDNKAIRVLLREHYFRVMPNHRHHRVIVWSLFLTIAAILAVQFAYPLDRGLPLARLGGTMAAFMPREQVAKLVADQFDQTEFKFVVGNKIYQRPLKLAGAEPDTELVVSKMVEYPFLQRFIPLSILWQPAMVDSLPLAFEQSQIDATIAEAVKTVSYPPQDAVLEIKDGNLRLAEAASGQEVTADQLKQSLLQGTIRPGIVMSLTVVPRVVPAERNLQDLAAVRSQAEAALHHTLVIQVEGQPVELSQNTIASWLALTKDDKGVIHLELSDTSLDTFASELNKKFGVAAGETNVTVVNGHETARTAGISGRTVNVEALHVELQRQLIDGTPSRPITVSFLPTTPTIIYNNTYSATRDGLQSYVNDISKSRNMRIMIQQLDGQKWEVEARAHESTPSASTYKLFVALELFERIDKGEFTWNSPILDTTFDKCFDRMTIASTNPCAEKWLEMFGGYSAMNDFVYSRGFSDATDFTNPVAKHTSAADLTQYMIGLEQGTLLGGANRDRLLHSLSVHPYRYGIPTGSKGVVWDKVGFLWDYVHDTAIVHHPQGTYVMTIMSKGQSYARIAEVTREIERIMYP